jgi:hypothetical protein
MYRVARKLFTRCPLEEMGLFIVQLTRKLCNLFAILIMLICFSLKRLVLFFIRCLISVGKQYAFVMFRLVVFTMLKLQSKDDSIDCPLICILLALSGC